MKSKSRLARRRSVSNEDYLRQKNSPRAAAAACPTQGGSPPPTRIPPASKISKYLPSSIGLTGRLTGIVVVIVVLYR